MVTGSKVVRVRLGDGKVYGQHWGYACGCTSTITTFGLTLLNHMPTTNHNPKLYP